jgi:hypothetical protein
MEMPASTSSVIASCDLFSSRKRATRSRKLVARRAQAERQAVPRHSRAETSHDATKAAIRRIMRQSDPTASGDAADRLLAAFEQASGASSSVAASPRQVDTVPVTRSAIGLRTLDFGTVP